MKPSFAPLQFLLLVFSGWVNREQQAVIDYLREENAVQGLGNHIIEPENTDVAPGNGTVLRRQRLGGMLNFYHRDAA